MSFRVAHQDLVREFQISEAQDEWAWRKGTGSSKAQAAGRFTAESVPVPLASRKGPASFEKDEHNRPATTLETLAALKPAFREGGTITAGNAPGLNSAAAATAPSSRDRRHLAPVARLVSYGIAAVEPGVGLGPIPPVRQALERRGWKISDVERVEINEAFAAIVIAVVRELGLPEGIVNVEGRRNRPWPSDATESSRHASSIPCGGMGQAWRCHPRIGGGQGIALAIEILA